MPVKEAPRRQRPVVTLRRIEHHLDYAFNVPVRLSQAADVEPETARNRGAHLVAVECLAFDFTRFQNLLGQRVENGFRPQLKAETFHAADESTLLVPHIDETRGNTR